MYYYFIGKSRHGASLFLTTRHPASRDGVPVVVLGVPGMCLRMAFGPLDIVDIINAGEYVGMWLREKERTEEERQAGEAFLNSGGPDTYAGAAWEMQERE